MLAICLLNGAEEGWKTVQSFLVESFNHLASRSGTNKDAEKRNWILVTRIVLRIFEWLQQIRAPAANLPLMSTWGPDPAARAYFSGQILWATLRSYHFMLGLKKLGIAKSPLAVSEFTNYLVEGHVHPVQMTALTTRVTGVEAKLNANRQRGQSST